MGWGQEQIMALESVWLKEEPEVTRNSAAMIKLGRSLQVHHSAHREGQGDDFKTHEEEAAGKPEPLHVLRNRSSYRFL